MISDWIKFAKDTAPTLYREYFWIWRDNPKAKDNLEKILELVVKTDFEKGKGLPPKSRDVEVVLKAFELALKIPPPPAQPEVKA